MINNDFFLLFTIKEFKIVVNPIKKDENIYFDGSVLERN